MQILDGLIVSWLGWGYKTYIRKTGWGDGIFDEKTGLMRPQMARLYSRPYAKAVVGTIQYMNYNDDTGVFSLKWTVPANMSSTVYTEVSLNAKWHYPHGYNALVTPYNANTHWTDKNTLYIKTKTSQFPQSIELTVRPN